MYRMQYTVVPGEIQLSDAEYPISQAAPRGDGHTRIRRSCSRALSSSRQLRTGWSRPLNARLIEDLAHSASCGERLGGSVHGD